MRTRAVTLLCADVLLASLISRMIPGNGPFVCVCLSSNFVYAEGLQCDAYICMEAWTKEVSLAYLLLRSLSLISPILRDTLSYRVTCITTYSAYNCTDGPVIPGKL